LIFRKALKNFIFSSITLSLVFSVAIGGLSPVYADKSTSEKLEEAKKTEEETEDRLDETEDRLDDLKDTQSELKSNLSDLNSKLENVSDKLGDIEENIRKKEEEISDAGTVLEETEEEAKNQYKFIKARIRTQYEKGKESYLELFFQTSNFSDFLNRAEYISRVNQYDHEMLERYKEKIKDIKAQKAELEKEKTELDSLREDAAAEQNRVKELVDNTRNSITAYAGEISVAEAEALAYEAKLIAARNTVSALKEQLKKEEELARLSEKMKKRSLDEVSIGAGEEDMLAALIQCEAGGEPWAGKVAVGAVVMNRVMSGAFPNTITGVIYQPGQFEPVTSGRFAIVLSQGANAECYKAARAAMNGENNIGECLFFRTIVPGIKGTIIGHHVFYLYWTGKYSGYGTADETLENAKKPEDSDEEGLEEEEYTEEEEQEEEDAPVEEEPEEEQQEEENNDEGGEAAEENDA